MYIQPKHFKFFSLSFLTPLSSLDSLSLSLSLSLFLSLFNLEKEEEKEEE